MTLNHGILARAAVFVCTTLWCVVSAPVEAQTVRVRTNTLGKASQFKRSDFTVEAQRTLNQSVSIWAWDAAPGFVGTLDLHVDARYRHDFGARGEDVGNPFVETDRSRFLLDVANLRWKPVARVRLDAGRQWVPSPLGVRDIDGVRLRWTPPLTTDITAKVDAYAGFEVNAGWATVNGDDWDVQGLPLPEDGSSPGGRRYGLTTGLALPDARLDVAWQRRDGVDADDEQYRGSERVGAAMSGAVGRRVVVSATSSYHTILGEVDRADLNLGWREPWAGTVLSGGLEHRQPWFDSSSIFNVFGARPFHGAYLTYQVPVSRLNTSFEARSWTRLYDGNFDLGDFAGSPEDARAYGAAVGHTTRFRGFGRTWKWRTFGSWQSSDDRAQGGTQWLGDVRFEVPAIRDVIILDGRFLGLRANPGVSSRYREGGAVTAVIGGRVPTSFGTFRLSVEGQSSTYFGGNTNVFASFESELWL